MSRTIGALLLAILCSCSGSIKMKGRALLLPSSTGLHAVEVTSIDGEQVETAKRRFELTPGRTHTIGYRCVSDPGKPQVLLHPFYEPTVFNFWCVRGLGYVSFAAPPP